MWYRDTKWVNVGKMASTDLFNLYNPWYLWNTVKWSSVKQGVPVNWVKKSDKENCIVHNSGYIGL